MDAARTAHDREDERGIDTDHPASPGDLFVTAVDGADAGATGGDGD
jgi:polyphosphate kinase